MSNRDWLAAAEASELQEIAPGPDVGNESTWTANFMTLGPKIYARRVMERCARQFGARLVRIRRQGEIMNPFTGEQNNLFVATFRRFDA